MSELLYSLVTEMSGGYPDVPLAPGVQFDDQEDKPFLVTLPLLKVGGQSRNGFTWERADVERVQEQIVSKRVEGGVGHVAPDKRSTQYDLPKLRWVGATLQGDTLWGKVYVPSYASDVREFFKDAFRTHAKVGTSVYGVRGKQGLSDMTLESIDLGHPDRLGFEGAGAVPLITSELQQEDTEMSDTNDALVTELKQDRDEQRQLVSELQDTLKERDKTIAELQQDQTTLHALVSEFGLGDNPLADAKALKTRLALLSQKELVSEIEAVVAEMIDNEPLRPYILEYLVEETDDGARKPLIASLDEAKARVTALLKKQNIVDLAKILVREQRGPNVIIRQGDGQKPVEINAEFVKAAREKFSF